MKFKLSFLALSVLVLATAGWSQEPARLRVSTLFVGASLLPIWIAQDQSHFKNASDWSVQTIPFLPQSLLYAARVYRQRSALKAFFVGLIEGTKKQKDDKELSLRLIRKHLRLDSPDVIEAAYEDAITVSYPYFTQRQFQVALDLLNKSLGQSVDISYRRVVDHTLVEEIARAGGF